MKKTNIIWKAIWKSFMNLSLTILGIVACVSLIILFILFSEETCKIFIIPAEGIMIYWTIKYAKRFNNFINMIATMATIVEEKVTIAE